MIKSLMSQFDFLNEHIRGLENEMAEKMNPYAHLIEELDKIRKLDPTYESTKKLFQQLAAPSVTGSYLLRNDRLTGQPFVTYRILPEGLRIGFIVNREHFEFIAQEELKSRGDQKTKFRRFIYELGKPENHNWVFE